MGVSGGKGWKWLLGCPEGIWADPGRRGWICQGSWGCHGRAGQGMRSWGGCWSLITEFQRIPALAFPPEQVKLHLHTAPWHCPHPIQAESPSNTESFGVLSFSMAKLHSRGSSSAGRELWWLCWIQSPPATKTSPVRGDEDPKEQKEILIFLPKGLLHLQRRCCSVRCIFILWLLISCMLTSPRNCWQGQQHMLQQQEYGCAGNRATFGEFIQPFLPARSCKIAIIEHFKETTVAGALGVQTQPKKKMSGDLLKALPGNSF